MSVVCFNSVLCLAPCKEIQDSLGSWIPRFGFRILGTGFQYLSVGTWILDSNRFWDSRIPWAVFSDSKTQESGFHKQKFPGFSYMGRIVLLRFSLYWIKIVLGRRITCLPELHWACQLFLHFVTKLDELFTSEKKCWLGKKDDPPS